MRKPEFYRLLNPKEQLLASKVFANTLPPWPQIGIGNGLGVGGDPWTSTGNANFPQTPNVRYMINVGDVAGMDLTSTTGTYSALGANYGTVCELFIHEMTHVWQYFHGFSVILSSAWAHSPFSSYDFTAGGSWESYNAEQQASLVELWQHRGNKEDDELYPYILWVLQGGGTAQFRKMTLAQLRSLPQIGLAPEDVPVRISVQDDAYVIKLPSDALFELNRDVLNPAAIAVLQHAGVRIKASPDRSVVVQGHTDNTGNAAYNLELSKRRAQAVAHWLTANGFVSSAAVEGRGMLVPVDSNNTAAGRAKNRRVEILLVKR